MTPVVASPPSGDLTREVADLPGVLRVRSQCPEAWQGVAGGIDRLACSTPESRMSLFRLISRRWSSESAISGASLGLRVRVACHPRQYHRAAPRGRPANRAGKPAGPVLAPESSESSSPPDLYNWAAFASPGLIYPWPVVTDLHMCGCPADLRCLGPCKDLRSMLGWEPVSRVATVPSLVTSVPK